MPKLNLGETQTIKKRLLTSIFAFRRDGKKWKRTARENYISVSFVIECVQEFFV